MSEQRPVTQADLKELKDLQSDHVKEVRDSLLEHGKMLARIDERTKDTKSRMDRMDRRAMMSGGLSGVVTALATFFAMMGLGHKG